MSNSETLKQIMRFGYRCVPFKRPLFQTMRSIYMPPENIYQHFHFEGQFDTQIEDVRFVMNNHSSKLETSIFWAGVLGGYEKQSLRLWAALAKSARTIFDIGANTGVFSLVAKALNAQAAVYSFEPIRRIYDLMITNFQDNRFDIQHFNCALSNRSQVGTIFDLKLKHHYHASLHREDITYSDDQIVEREVQIKRLDEFIDERAIGGIDLMKIDVEGHEAEVLEGMGRYLQIMQPTIILEIKSADKARKIEELLRGTSYLFFDIDEESEPRITTSLSKSSSWNYLLCRPNIAEQLGSTGATWNARTADWLGAGR